MVLLSVLILALVAPFVTGDSLYDVTRTTFQLDMRDDANIRDFVSGISYSKSGGGVTCGVGSTPFGQCGLCTFDGTSFLQASALAVGMPSTADKRTMCAWGKQSTGIDTGVPHYIFSYGSDTAYNGWYIGTNTNNLIYGGGYGAADVSSSSYWTAGQWNHLCIKYDSTTVTMYQNGVAVASSPRSLSTGSSQNQIGALFGHYIWSGQLFDVVGFGFDLSDAQILSLYNSPCAPFPLHTFGAPMYCPATTVPGAELVQNGGFESGISSWSYAQGVGMASQCGGCGTYTLKMWDGVQPSPAQSVQVNQVEARPVVISAMVKGVNVVGPVGADASLYVDIIYIDNTFLYSTYSAFPNGTFDWTLCTFTLYPTKPIYIFTINVLFRNGRTGTVYVDNISAKEKRDIPVTVWPAITSTSTYTMNWNNQGSNEVEHIQCMNANGGGGTYPLGTNCLIKSVTGYSEVWNYSPPDQSYVVADQAGLTDIVNSYQLTWQSGGMGTVNGAMWVPYCNTGFSSLGDVMGTEWATPTSTDFRCINSTYVKFKYISSPAWTDQISGRSSSIWLTSSYYARSKEGAACCPVGMPTQLRTSMTCPGGCGSHGTCDMLSGTCYCDTGYTGAQCTDLDECNPGPYYSHFIQSAPCGVGQTCLNHIGGWSCVNVTGVQSKCYTPSIGNITASVIASYGPSGAPFTWTINGLESTTSTNALWTRVSGDYIVTITNKDGISINITASITRPAPLPLSITSITPESCFGAQDGSMIVSGSGEGLVKFSLNSIYTTPQTGSVFSPLPPGSYDVTLTDGVGCMATTSVVVQPAAQLTATTSVTPPACHGGSGVVSVIASGGTGNYTYTINGGITFQNASSFTVPVGSYVTEVFDSHSCFVQKQVNVTQPSVVVANATASLPICSAYSNVSVSAAGGSSDYQFRLVEGGSWDSNPSFYLLGGQSYHIDVRDSAGCTIATPIEVSPLANTVPNAIATPPYLSIDYALGVVVISWYSLRYPDQTGYTEIISYVIEHREVCSQSNTSSEWYSTIVSPVLLSTTIAYNYTVTYDIRVSAVNCMGTGAPSPISSVGTPDNLELLQIESVTDVPAQGGFLTITGLNFGATSSLQVFLDDVQLPTNKITSSTDTQIVCEVAAGFGELHNVTVTTSSGSLCGQMQALAQWSYSKPEISWNSVLSTTGNSSFLINGTNFGTADRPVTVLINNVPCSGCSIVIDYTQINCTSCPPGFGADNQLVVKISDVYSPTYSFAYAACSPPCVNGKCIDTGVCSCEEGWTGSQCDKAAYCTPSQSNTKSLCGYCETGLCCHFAKK